jgi:hypothetical protein
MEPVANLGVDPQLSKAVFSAQPGAWMDTAFGVEEGAALLRLDKRIPPKEESWKSASPALMDSLTKARKEESFQSFVNLLAAKARITRKQVNFQE